MGLLIRALSGFVSLQVCLIVFTNSPRLDYRSLVGTVVKVTDGDTITVIDKEQFVHRVRLMGIDAPERNHLLNPKRFIRFLHNSLEGETGCEFVQSRFR